MRSHYLALALLVGLGVALLGSRPCPAGETAGTEKIDKLIEQMGSGAFAEREKATKELDAIGVPALAALRKAVKSDDAEVRKRAEDLVKKIEKQAESAAILAPKRLHLVYKDTPLAEAVADFQKKCGYTIHLHDPDGKLKERKITLDTGETTFWRAYELFCAKAGLTEATMQDVMQVPGGFPVPAPLPPQRIRRLPPERIKPVPDAPAPAPPERKPGLGFLAAETPAAPPAVKPLRDQPAPAAPPRKPVAAQGVVRGMMPALPFMPGSPGQLMLKDGKFKKLPADDGSAVRVRALPKADMFGAAPAGEVILALEVTPEPKLQWQSMQALRITRAIDDQDQKLSQIIPQVPAPAGFGGAGIGIALPPNMAGAAMPMWGGGGMNQQIPLQLKKGEKAAKSLKELKGVITAQVLSEAKPMITADNLAKAAGKTFKGEEGGALKIVSVKTDEEKKTTIQFELEQPPNAVPAAGQNMGMPGGAIMPPIPMRIKVRPAGVPGPAVPPPAPPAPAAQAPAVKFQAVRQQAQVQVQIGGGQGGGIVIMQPAIAGGGFIGPFNGVSVQDDKGNTLPVQMGPQQFRMMALPNGNNMFVATTTLICQPGKDQRQPTKLVFSGRKRVTIDIPFTLKDVPLP